MNHDLIAANKQQIVSEVDTFTTRRYQSFLKYIGSNHTKVLDFGCNTGRGGLLLKSIRPELILTGADIVTERLLKVPKEVYDKIIDLSQTSFENENFDVIVSGEVVEHIPFTILVDYLYKFRELINPNGLLILTTPNPNSFLVRIGRDSVLKDPSHVNIMSISFLQTLLQKVGYKDVIIKGSGKATKYLGENFPVLNMYGSYLIIAQK